MKYRTLGKTGEKVSILGFGAMRLPHFENNNQINVEESDKILSYGIEMELILLILLILIMQITYLEKEIVKSILETSCMKIHIGMKSF